MYGYECIDEMSRKECMDKTILMRFLEKNV